MGMSIEEDLPKVRGILLKIDENILQLNNAIEHLYAKIAHYRKILAGKHHFNTDSMNREIDDARNEIKKMEATITTEKEKKDHYRKIRKTLKERLRNVNKN